jgi:branched-chain amino acid transport system substrate-binding protein
VVRIASRDGPARRHTAAVSLLAALSLLAAACGGDDSDTGSTDTGGGGVGGGVAEPGEPSPLLGNTNRATEPPVKIGLFNLEGGAVSRPEVGDAAEAAAKYANEHLGGLGGHEIQVVRCADHGDAATATACAELFVEEQVAAVVVGQAGTADVLVPVVRGAGIPYVGTEPISTAETSTEGLFFFSPGLLGTLSAWANYAEQKGYERFGVFLADDPLAAGAMLSAGTTLFVKAGVVLQVSTVPAGTEDASFVVQLALNQFPDAVGIVADSPTCQVVLTALRGAPQIPKLGTKPCLAREVVDAVGAASLDGMVLFEVGDTISDNREATLYRAIMRQYAPESDAGGNASTGYVAMLGLIRAIDAAGDRIDPTPANLDAALRAAERVPLPAGNGKTFSCDGNAMAATTVIKATICNPTLFLSKVNGTTQGKDFAPVDTSELFRQ